MASVQTSSYGGRYLKLTVVEESVSIENNTSTLKWTLESIGGSSNYYSIYGCKVIVNGSIVHNSGTTEWTTHNFPAAKGEETGTIVVSHKADGSADDVSFSLTGSVYNNNPQTYSGTIELTSISRQANINTAPNFNDEENPKITYTNSAGNSVSSLQACISLTGEDADISYRDISKTGTEYTFNLTTAERNVLRNACTTSSSRDVVFIVKTVIGNNTYYSSLTKQLSIVNAKPTFSSSNITYQDINSSSVAITGNNQHIVRNISQLRVTLASAVANKGASISRYEITFNGSTQNKTASGNIDYGIVNLSSNSKVSVKVIDSRGNSTTVEKDITILDWILPNAIISANRKNNYEDETTITVNASCSSVNQKNSIMSIKYRYKKTTETSYSSYTSISNNSSTIINFDKTFAWNIQVEIKDKFGTVTYNVPLTKGTPIMFIDVKKLAVAINGFPTENGGLDVYGKIKSNGKLLQSYYSLDLSSLSTSNFYPVTFLPGNNILDCEIHSQGGNASEAYNQNVIHFKSLSQGWSDTPTSLEILMYENYDNNEITIGCIGFGGRAAYEHAVWLRGGLTYNIYANFEPTLHTTDYTSGYSGATATFTVGTNYYGGNNDNINITFTPQSTISRGAYFYNNLRVNGDITGNITANNVVVPGFNSQGILTNIMQYWSSSDTSSFNTQLTEFKNYVLNTITAGTTFVTCNFNGNHLTAWVEKANNNYASFILANYGKFSQYRYSGTWSEVQLDKTEMVLYDNSTGSNGDITLNDSVANYKYIEIYFKDNNGKYGGYNRVYSPNGKEVHLSMIEPTSSANLIRNTAYSISGTTMIVGSCGYAQISASSVSRNMSQNYIYITRVVGLN